jgi:hypothetical protein
MRLIKVLLVLGLVSCDKDILIEPKVDPTTVTVEVEGFLNEMNVFKNTTKISDLNWIENQIYTYTLDSVGQKLTILGGCYTPTVSSDYVCLVKISINNEPSQNIYVQTDVSNSLRWEYLKIQ